MATLVELAVTAVYLGKNYCGHAHSVASACSKPQSKKEKVVLCYCDAVQGVTLDHIPTSSLKWIHEGVPDLAVLFNGYLAHLDRYCPVLCRHRIAPWS